MGRGTIVVCGFGKPAKMLCAYSMNFFDDVIVAFEITAQASFFELGKC